MANSQNPSGHQASEYEHQTDSEPEDVHRAVVIDDETLADGVHQVVEPAGAVDAAVEEAADAGPPRQDDSMADFEEAPPRAARRVLQHVVQERVQEQNKENPVAEGKKPKRARKRKAAEVEEESDEGSCCTICFETWSNSGEHRISSLK